MKDTTWRGDVAETQITAALVQTHSTVLRPLSNGLRYDLAIDRHDGTLLRVQCKTGVLRDGCITFRVCSPDHRRPKGVSYEGQIDAFAVFCPGNGRSYLVPINAVAGRRERAMLRVSPARNGQRKRVRYAVDYELLAPASVPPFGAGS